MMQTRMKENNKNKRQYNRKQLYYYLKVYHAGNGTFAGYLGDLSARGMMLFSQTPIEPGQDMTLEIELSPDFGLGKSLVLDTRSVWCEPDANPEYHVLGFSLMEIGQTELDVIAYLMEKYGFDK